jgi:RHS repeat-associated protein
MSRTLPATASIGMISGAPSHAGGRGARRVFTGLALALALALPAAPVAADTGTALGDRSGEGSTPFTGLAQAPEANLFTGALNTAVPIEVPPGRRGLTPQLALQYSSSAGPGVFGFGWDVPIGRIERSTTRGAPRCTGAHTDDFALVLPSGASKLVRTAPGSNYYRPAVEQAYVRAEKFQSQNHWVVYDRSGLKYTFGDVDAARLGNSTPLTFLSQGADGICRLTSTWALTRIEDANGNTIEIAWGKILNVLYPVTVRYGGNARAGGPGHLYTVRFLPEFRPPADRLISHRTGVPTRLLLRIYAIQVESDLPAAGSIVRRYSLQYRDGGPGAQADGYQSMLSAVTVTGRPTQHFAYTPSVTGHDAALATIAKPAGAYAELRVSNDSLEVSQSVLDMNGDGLLDLVRSDDPPAASWAVYWGSAGADGSFGFSATPIAWQAPGSWLHLRDVLVSSGGCDSNGWSCTRTDTFDITGDGIPDHVDASGASNWVVYKGRGVPQWGFAPGVSWPAPNRRYVRRTRERDTYQDVVDMNGDGLPDLVVSGGPGDSAPFEWDVYLNTGSGFAPAPLPAFPAPAATIVHQVSRSIRHELIDFNGDGLPDLVGGSGNVIDARCAPSAHAYTSCLEVYFNTSQGFDPAPTLIPVPLGVDVQHGLGNDDDRRVVQDLFDVNGDGLPDWVDRRFSALPGYEAEWRVLLNLGGTLEPLIYVQADLPASFTYGIPGRVWDGGQGDLRHTVARNTRTDLIDVNGDGFLDHVTAGGATWSVRLHDARERPNLLGLMENGLGGTNTIVYRPSTAYDNRGGDAQPDLPFITWVVDKTRQNDGLCTPPATANVFEPGPAPARNPCIDSGHELVATYLYEDGRFDAVEREFRGFRRVVRTGVEGSGTPGNQTVTYFGQDPVVNGRILQVDTYAGSAALVRSEVNLWGTRSAGPGRSQIWLAENRRTQWDLIGSGAPQFVSTVSDPPDAYGNITHHSSSGLNGAARVDTYTAYAAPLSGWQVFDRPASARITDAGGVLEEKWFYYDGSSTAGLAFGTVMQGNLKRVVARATPSNASGPATKMTYDAYGNVVTVTDANGHATTTVYDQRALYPYAVINAAYHVNVTLIDHRWGQPTSVTDQNAVVTRYAYDSAGRRTCVARPGDSLANCSVTTSYHFAAQPGELSFVEIAERQDAPHPPLVTRHYFDALGRPRYSDGFRVVDGFPTIVRSNHVVYDPGGRARTLYHPYLANAGAANNGATTYDYHLNGSPYLDPLGRVYRTINADQTERRTEYLASITRSFDEEGQRTETVADPFGRAVLRIAYDGAALYAVTLRAYDGLGRLRSLSQNGKLLRTISYDSLGRKTQMVDQDSGTWRYAYDGVGNLVWQDDPRPGGHVEFCYDAINRPTRRCAFANDSTVLASCATASACTDPDAVFTRYDDIAVPYGRGRLTRVDDASGTTQIDEYDQRGRERRRTRSIALNEGTGHAHFAHGYDTNDRVVSTTYPDGEIVFTEYDDGGQPIALRNQANDFYVTDALYDIFGRPSRVDHANSVSDTRAYGPASNRHRLVALTSAKGATKHLDLAYSSYTGRGLLAQVTDRRNLLGELSNSAGFTYDAVGRLTFFDSAHGPLDAAFAYDAMGNLTRRGDRWLRFDNPAKPHQATTLHIGSPVAPGLSVVHDPNGNRTVKGAQAYEYDSGDRLAHVIASGGEVEVVYDYRGQQAATITTSGSATRATRFYGAQAETSNGILTKWYFLGPLRIASQATNDVGWETAALDRASVWLATASLDHPGVVLVLTREAGWMAGAIVLCIATGLLVAPWRRRPVVGIAVRPGHAILVALACAVGTLPWPVAVQPAPVAALAAGTVRHYHVDHLGSTQVVTDPAGDIVEQIRYLPYGTVRGHWDRQNVPIANPGDANRREFAGYLSEPLSGLQYAGARFYDPDIGSFLTHDPATQFASPYSYGGGDPVNWTDPGGAEFVLGTFLIALVVSAVASAAINAVIAAAQGLPGNAIGKAALGGAIAGAVGVGLGVVASAASMGAASAAGTLPANVTFNTAVEALGEVATRSAFSTTIANTAGQVAAAAGAPSDAVTAIALVTGLFASVGYDQAFLRTDGVLARSESTGDFPSCSNTCAHTDITLAAAEDAGFSRNESHAILQSNLARDRGWWNTLNNQDHFDFGAQGAVDKYGALARGLIKGGADLNHADVLEALGSATHHVEDQFALGHITPGTSLFGGPAGSPIRFIVHNLVGGEVTFRQASYDATREFLQEMRGLVGPRA